jgi:hypothetical protein
MTPEGRVKQAIDRSIVKLRESGVPIYSHKPVQNGMGMPTLDYIGCCGGRYFAIEAKAPGKTLTPRQETTRHSIMAASGVVFEVRDALGVQLFEEWARRTVFLEAL